MYEVQTVAILCFYPRSAIVSGYTGRITSAFCSVSLTTKHVCRPPCIYNAYPPFGRVHYEEKIMENVHSVGRQFEKIKLSTTIFSPCSVTPNTASAASMAAFEVFYTFEKYKNHDDATWPQNPVTLRIIIYYIYIYI